MKWRKREPKMEYSEFDSLYDQLAKINGIEDVNRFLNPSESDLHSPYGIMNMEKAAYRITKAVNDGESIAIHLDPDGDGNSSGAILYNYLINFTTNVQMFHSQRSKGHGIHNSMNDIPDGTQLLIILDSSSSEWKECKDIQRMGIDVIVVDHHICEEPNYHCILVNPQQEGDTYPNKELSGAGLTWKLCKILDDKLDISLADDYLDLVALGMLADMMDTLNPENRYMISKGLSNVKNKGILAILKVKGKNPDYLTSTHIGFDVAPFINAACRLNQMELSVELLTSDDFNRCLELAKEIEKLNKKRKDKQTIHIEEFKELINEEDKIIIIINQDVGKSFSGLVANEIAQKYQRPCLILARDSGDGNLYNGSYRSYGDFNLKEYFNSLSTVESTGGHNAAGGCSVKAGNLEAFIKEAKEGLENVDFEQVIEYDLEIPANEITEDFIRKVEFFYRISGKGFNKAKFLIKDLFVADQDDAKVMGKNKDTVKVNCGNVSLMKFKTNEEFAQQFCAFSMWEAVGTLGINVFYNFGTKRTEKTNQIIVDDLRMVC